MLKTNILTPVLSVVLAGTVAGSGVLYVLDKKDGDTTKKDGTWTERNENTVLAKVSDKINDAAETVEKAANGELTEGYTVNAELNFGELLTDEIGCDVKTVALKADSKVKGGKSETDLALSYDGKSLATAYLITDSETNTVYLKCPELNDAYLTLSSEDLEQLLSKSGMTGAMGSVIGKGQLGMLGGLGASSITSAQAAPDLSSLADSLKEIDLEGISKEFEEYCKIVEDAIPEGTKKDNITGDISGHSYDYEVKSVEVTLGTVNDILTAVINKAKDDAYLKEQLAKSGIDESQYDQLLDQLSAVTNRMTAEQLEQKLFTIDMYSYEGEDVGFALDLSGKGEIKMISINTEDVFAIDLSGSFGSAGLSLNGAFEMKDDIVNGSADLKFSDGENTSNASLTMKDVNASANAFSGSIGFTLKSGEHDVAFNLVSASTEDNVDIKLNFDAEGKDAVDLSITGEKTGASDVTVPSGTMYKLDQDGLKQYEQTSDVDGFKKHISEVLGSELAEKIFNKAQLNTQIEE